MKTLKNCVLILILALTITFGANVRAADRAVKTYVKSTVVNKYGRSSYTSRSSTGVKTNIVPYGRSSYIQRTYSKGGTLQRTQIVVPYGNGWLIR